MKKIITVLIISFLISCTSKTNLIQEIDAKIAQEKTKIENNTKENELDLKQMEFISLELEAAKLKSNKTDRIRSSEEITNRIKTILAKGKTREYEDSISKSIIDSLMFEKQKIVK